MRGERISRGGGGVELIWNFGLNPGLRIIDTRVECRGGVQRVKAMTAAKPEVVFRGRS
jgi:hypothetical protein